jgi:hypothetical protein
MVSGEQQVVEYPTFAAALADGAVARGWIPPWIPESARELREVHDLDTNERWLVFQMTVDDWWRAIPALVPRVLFGVPRDSVAQYLTSPPRAVGPAWPSALALPASERPRRWRFVTLYRSRADRYCLAVDWQTGEAWGWSCEAAG